MSPLLAYVRDISLLIGVLLGYLKIRSEVRKGSIKQIEAGEAAQDKLNGWLQIVLDAYPGPAWVKKVVRRDDGKVDFIMYAMNGKYESYFGITRSQYLYKTDFEVWPHDIASAYYGHDTTVLASKGNDRFVEPISQTLASAFPQLAGKVYEFNKVYIERYDAEYIFGTMCEPVAVAP